MSTKTNMEKTMEDILELSPDTQSMKEVLSSGEVLPAREIINSDNITDEDFEYARDNLKSIIDNGTATIEELSSIASTSESPRAFEVLSALMKTIVDANKDLLELQSVITKRTIPSDMMNEDLNQHYSESKGEYINLIDMDIIHLIRAYSKCLEGNTIPLNFFAINDTNILVEKLESVSRIVASAKDLLVDKS